MNSWAPQWNMITLHGNSKARRAIIDHVFCVPGVAEEAGKTHKVDSRSTLQVSGDQAMSG